MNELEKVFCEKCGSEMIPLDAERSIGMTCPKCGWGWVTSYFEPIDCDTNDYQVTLLSGGDCSTKNIRVISKIVNVNFIRARQIISSAPQIIFTGKARDVKEVILLLNKQKLSYSVQPDFPYLVDDLT